MIFKIIYTKEYISDILYIDFSFLYYGFLCVKN